MKVTPARAFASRTSRSLLAGPRRPWRIRPGASDLGPSILSRDRGRSEFSTSQSPGVLPASMGSSITPDVLHGQPTIAFTIGTCSSL